MVDGREPFYAVHYIAKNTRFRSVSMGMFDHFSRSAFVRSDTIGLWAGQSNSSTPNSLIHVFMDLDCALACSHVGTGRRHPQTVPTELGS